MTHIIATEAAAFILVQCYWLFVHNVCISECFYDLNSCPFLKNYSTNLFLHEKTANKFMAQLGKFS